MDKGIQDKFNISFEYETGRSFLVLKLIQAGDVHIYNYQIEMIAGNPRPFIVPFEVRRKNDEVSFYYNITSKVPLMDFIRSRGLSKHDFIVLLSTLADNLLESKSLFLNERNFILSKELMYVDHANGCLCMLYVPVETNADYYRQLKDFLIEIITRVRFTGMQAGDNFLQRIIEYIKAAEFNTAGLAKILNDIKSEGAYPVHSSCGSGTGGQVPHFPGSRGDPESGVLPGKSNPDLNTGPTKVTLDFNTKIGGYSIRTILTALFTQLIIISLAAGVEIFMKHQGIGPDTRYISIGVFVFVVDLLVFKHLILNREKGAGSQEREEVQSAKEQTKIESGKRVKDGQTGFEEPGIPYMASNSQDCEEANTGRIIDKGLCCYGSWRDVEETTLLCTPGRLNAFLICEKDGTIREIKINKDRFIIGRNPYTSDLVIEDKAVGRVHAEIIYKGGEYFIVDKYSKNSTYLNEEKLVGGQEYKLNNNDVIVFANAGYKFCRM